MCKPNNAVAQAPCSSYSLTHEPSISLGPEVIKGIWEHFVPSEYNFFTRYKLSGGVSHAA